MASPPSECVSLSVIHHSPADFPWYPAAAVSCGKYAGVEYFRQGALPPPPPPPPPPPAPAPRPAPPADCVSVMTIHHSPVDFPWFPAAAAPCGSFDGVAYYRYDPSRQPPVVVPPGDAGETGETGARTDQPAGDVDADEDPDAYLLGDELEPVADEAAVGDAADALGDV